MKKAVAFLVSVEPPGNKIVRINLTAREPDRANRRGGEEAAPEPVSLYVAIGARPQEEIPRLTHSRAIRYSEKV
jgi:hypothetical protein